MAFIKKVKLPDGSVRTLADGRFDIVYPSEGDYLAYDASSNSWINKWPVLNFCGMYGSSVPGNSFEYEHIWTNSSHLYDYENQAFHVIDDNGLVTPTVVAPRADVLYYHEAYRCFFRYADGGLLPMGKCGRGLIYEKAKTGYYTLLWVIPTADSAQMIELLDDGVEDDTAVTNIRIYSAVDGGDGSMCFKHAIGTTHSLVLHNSMGDDVTLQVDCCGTSRKADCLYAGIDIMNYNFTIPVDGWVELNLMVLDDGTGESLPSLMVRNDIFV